MTAKHMLDGAMQWTKSRDHSQFARLTGLDNSTLSRLYKGRCQGMRIETLDLIQRTTGIPIETLWAWYRLPEGETLGRIAAPA